MEINLELWCAETRELGKQARRNRGFVPPPAFYAVSDALITVPVEVLAIRAGDDGVTRVLFVRRPANDPFFGGMLHTPGGVVRPGVTHEDVLHEVVAEEVVRGPCAEYQIAAVLPPVSVRRGTGYGECPRGQYVCLPHIVTVDYGAWMGDGNEWHPWNNLPTNVPSYQLVHLLPALCAWIRTNRES